MAATLRVTRVVENIANTAARAPEEHVGQGLGSGSDLTQLDVMDGGDTGNEQGDAEQGGSGSGSTGDHGNEGGGWKRPVLC